MKLVRTVVAEELDSLGADDPSAMRSRRDLQRVHRAMGTCGVLVSELHTLAARNPARRAPVRRRPGRRSARHAASGRQQRDHRRQRGGHCLARCPGLSVRRFPADQGRRARHGHRQAGVRVPRRRAAGGPAPHSGVVAGAVRAGRSPLAREISKQFEQITTHPAHTLVAWLESNSQHSRVEFVVVIHPATQTAEHDPKEQQILQLLLAELPMKTAVKLAAQITGGARNRLYEMALALKSGSSDSADDAGEDSDNH